MPLTEDQTRRLARCANRHTLYEAVVIHPNGRRALLAYSRRGKRALAECVWKRADAVCAFLGVKDDTLVSDTRGSEQLTVAGGGTVSFSGRTQRDCIMEGDLPYVGDMHPANE